MATEFPHALPDGSLFDEPLQVERGTFSLKLAHWLDRSVFASLLLLFVVVAVPYGTVEPWWEALFECAIFALTVLWIIEGLCRGTWNLTERRLFLPLIALVIFTVLQAIPFDRVPGQEAAWFAISADPFNTLRFALKLIAIVLTGALLLSHLTTQRRLRGLIWTILLIALGSAVFGLLRQTAQTSTEGFVLPFLPLSAGYGQFINSNHFAYLMELSFGLPLSLLLARSRDHEKWLFFAGLALPLALALVLANSRGGLLGLGAQVLFVVVMTRQRAQESKAAPHKQVGRWMRTIRSRGFRLATGAVLAVVLFVGITWVGGDPLINKLEAVSGEVSAVGAPDREGTRRIDLWQATWQMIAQHPLAGTGYGGYPLAVTQYHQASGKLIPQQAHNEYLEVVASGGLIGTGLWVWFIVLFIRRAHQSLTEIVRTKHRALCVGALAGIVAVAVHSLVDFGLHITINALVCTALVVITLNCPALERSDKKLLFWLTPKV